MVQCDLVWLDGSSPVAPVAAHDPAPPARPASPSAGWVALAGTELEFIAFDTTYEQACDAGYRDLTPVNQYNVDYSILGTTRVEPLLRDIRNHMYAAGLDVEGAKGECNFGQHEIGFLYADALTTADNHAVYKTAAKEIAAQHGQGDHVHGEVRRARGQLLPHPPLAARRRDGELVFWDDEPASARRSTTTSSPACWRRCATSRCSTRPNINSYKRFAAGSFAPTTIAWGCDNRTCAVRLVGHGAGARMENRVPGADVNPYLALAAMLAGGLHGIEQRAAAARTSWSATPTPPTGRRCRTTLRGGP